MNVCNILSLLSCPINFHISLLLYVEDTHSKLSSDTWSHLKQHSINTLIDTWSSLNWLSNGILMIDRWSTLDWCLLGSWQSVYQLICIDWHSMVCLQKLFDSQPTVDQDVKQMLTKYWWRCWWNVDQRLIKVIDWHEHRFFLVHMIQIQITNHELKTWTKLSLSRGNDALGNFLLNMYL